jgi:hypothetical protein
MSAEKLITEAVNLEHTLKESQELVVSLLAEIDKLREELAIANNRIEISEDIICPCECGKI